MVKVGIIGAAGYTGGELIRLLLQHPAVSLVFAQSNSQAGMPLYQVHADLAGDTEMVFVKEPHFDVDVLFFCGGHGEAKKFVSSHCIPPSVKLIDLGNDFRLAADAVTNSHRFVYGLPEVNYEQIAAANAVANPGCFATAIQLALLPLAAHGLLTEAFVTGITGSTGAGQGLSVTSHFSWRASNIQAYKTLTHQHLGEIGQTLKQLTKTHSPAIHFVPWRGDFTRGIFVSAMVKVQQPLHNLLEIYQAFYKDKPFTKVVNQQVFLKQVVNTNKCLIQLEMQEHTLVIHSTIDNLLKGASGQAVQNMNIMCGLDETAGLRLKAAYF
jgi:N-acetyl-gamma-glutamyl-phosphate reductase